MNHIQQKRWWIDAVLFSSFLICFFLDLTGVSLHEWIGLAAGMLATYHLAAHWNWVRAVTGRLIGKTSSQARLYYLVNAGILAGFVAIAGTGLVISTWLNLALGNYAAWYALHVAASAGTLLLVTLKIGMHARWITAVGKRLLSASLAGARSGTGAAVPAVTGGDRRDFLRLMGLVGTASLFAFGSSFHDLFTSTSTEDVQASTGNTGWNPFTSSGTNSSTSCAVRCGKGCAYPGRCRRFIDNSENGCCDLGECA